MSRRRRVAPSPIVPTRLGLVQKLAVILGVQVEKLVCSSCFVGLRIDGVSGSRGTMNAGAERSGSEPRARAERPGGLAPDLGRCQHVQQGAEHVHDEQDALLQVGRNGLHSPCDDASSSRRRSCCKATYINREVV